MTTHAMIDLETLGAQNNTVVLTFGGVKFDPNSISETYQHFYHRLEVDEQIARGRTTDESTLEWWGRQDPKVMEEAMGEGNRTSVDQVLTDLTRWCVGVDAIWAQGSTFDIPIMENLFKQYEKHVPWPFWKIRDARTLMQIMPSDPRKAMNFEAHNALEDCKVQALCVQLVLQQLELTVR